MSDEITTTYCGIEIVYRERDNRWVFELRGRERTAESLMNAKAAIDKPEPKKKGKAFKPVEAWFSRFGDGWRKVTITSIAERNRYSSRQEVWITDKKEGRSKQDVEKLYPVDARNDAIIEELERLRQQGNELREKAHATARKLLPYTPPDDEDEPE